MKKYFYKKLITENVVSSGGGVAINLRELL